MKKILSLLIVLLALTLALTSCEIPFLNFFGNADNSTGDNATGDNTTGNGGNTGNPDCTHTDADDNGMCDSCYTSLIVYIDFYAINDLHGKFKDTGSNEGVDELTSYLKSRYTADEHVVLLSSGDMWQGSSESNLTRGNILTDWMSHLDFAAMTLGNHEYDWGEEYIESNGDLADFPLLAINVYNRSTNQRVSYSRASTVIDRGGIQIGIIGAIGDCYSSISGDKSQDFYIKTGTELTSLVKAEAQKLRSEGVDYIVYSIHDGYEESINGKKNVTRNDIANYYDTSLSNGYVDLVFEAHTHQRYILIDEYGVHHMQGGGENKGISHAEIGINSVTGSTKTNAANFISTSTYSTMKDDPIVNELLEKYKDEIAAADVLLGTNGSKLMSYEIKQLIAQLYYEYGVEKWGDKYNIVLGGGYLNTRNPYDLAAGEIRYSDLMSILPFDNNLVLCSIKGSDLMSRFFENDSYYIYYESYGTSVKNNINPNETYYVIVDTYSSTYAYNRLVEIERVTDEIYARDLLAEYIKNGGLAGGK